MKKIENVSVRGVLRNVYLERVLPSQNGIRKWQARVYVGPRSRTTVSGVFSVNRAGARRFTPAGINADLL